MGSLTSSKAVNLCVGCVMCQFEGLFVRERASVWCVSDGRRDLQLKQTVNSISPVPFILKIRPVKLSDGTFITCFNIGLCLSHLWIAFSFYKPLVLIALPFSHQNGVGDVSLEVFWVFWVGSSLQCLTVALLYVIYVF